LDDDWLQYEEDDPSKPPANQDAYERLLFGEIQSYHHRHYWDAISRTKKEKNVPSSSPSSNSMLVMEARKELDDPKLELDGGPICRFYNDLKLDSVHFCQQYEKWLDQEGITSSPNLNETLPLSF
jgi:hypothetical protein